MRQVSANQTVYMGGAGSGTVDGSQPGVHNKPIMLYAVAAAQPIKMAGGTASAALRLIR